MDKLYLLHLSDIHITDSPQARTWRNQLATDLGVELGVEVDDSETGQGEEIGFFPDCNGFWGAEIPSPSRHVGTVQSRNDFSNRSADLAGQRKVVRQIGITEQKI